MNRCEPLLLRWILVVISALSLIVGGLIYYCFRPDFLLMFSWAKLIGLGGVVSALRIGISPYEEQLPEFFIYSLPNGLWVFSFGTLMLSIWGRKHRANCHFWLTLLLILGAGSEFLQIFGVITGVFDIQDILAYAFGALCVLPFSIRAPKNADFHSTAA